MNNEEKRPEEVVEETVAEPAVAEKATPKEKTGGWWKKLSRNVQTAIISGAAVIVLAVIFITLALTGALGDDIKDALTGNSFNGPTVEYSVTVVTKGGMPMEKLPVYIFEYEDGELGEIVDGVSATTDSKGTAKFKLPQNGSYAARIDLSIPEGYDTLGYYPLVSNHLDITISSSVIPETSLSGVAYQLGSVMRDFTVTNTEGEKVTLSKLLETKKAVLLNFWYVDCSACQLEFPILNDAYKNHSDDIAVVALDPFDTGSEVEVFKDQYGLSFDVARDTVGLYEAFGVQYYPTSVMIDRYGVVTLLEAGAITSDRAWDVIFDLFAAENYVQQLVPYYADIIPREKPGVTMPPSEDIANAFEKDDLGDIIYRNDDSDEYSWPFVVGSMTDKEGDEPYSVIMPSNSEKESSYAQLIFDVTLEAGQVLAFDYYSSTERGADYMYVMVDKKDIYSISGESTKWETCYAFVPEEAGTYEIAFVYIKDSSTNVGNDTVYLRDLRIVSEQDIDSATYIYRFAAKNPNKYNEYQDYVEVFLNENDGYYHVGSPDGPILIANLMGYTRFDSEYSFYEMVVDKGKGYEAVAIRYCNYASNSQINGSCPVTEELAQILKQVALDNYGNPNNDKEWLEFCCYYDAYGTNGEQLPDPVKGLAPFSAYKTELSSKGTNNYPNEVTYDRVIMPRGLFHKFTPTTSGVYLVRSDSKDSSGKSIDCEGWIFKGDDFNGATIWYTYSSVDRNNVKNGYNGDLSNVYMLAYLEAGVDYYINIAYVDPYQEGTIKFRVERLGDEGYYRFSLASPNFYTFNETLENEIGKTVSGGIELELGADKYWREKRNDGRDGSLIYADFSHPTGLFNMSIMELIESGAFNFATTDNDEYILRLLKDDQTYNYYLKLYLKDLWGKDYNANYKKYMVDDVLAGKYHGDVGKDGKPQMSEDDKYIIDLRDSMANNTTYNTHANFKKFLKDSWTEEYFEEMYNEVYKVDDVLEGIYHGNEGEDYTDEMLKYASKMITEKNETEGCVIVDEDLANMLQMIVDKYSFSGVENSWAKLCYYHQYFGPTSPN